MRAGDRPALRDRPDSHRPPRPDRQGPVDVVIGASDFINGPLADNPQRVGKELDRPYHGVYSARVMQGWRVLYVIDETQHRVTIRDISHRRDT